MTIIFFNLKLHLDLDKYDFFIIFFIIAFVFCLVNIYLNYNNDKAMSGGIINVYTTLLIALISLIGIIFNLKDNDKLRNFYEKDRKNKLDYINKKHKNTALLIKYEVLDNLDIVEEFFPGIDMGDNICIGKLPCKNHAWNTLYKELPGVFDKNELNILIKFYQEINKLLDDRNWLKSVDGKEMGAIGGSWVQTNPLTEFDLEKIKNNKILISKILNNILELKEELNFIKKY